MIGALFRSGPRLVWRGVRDLGLHPWAQFLAMLTVTLVVFLAGLMLILLTTMDRSLSATPAETVIELYWKPDTDPDATRAQWEQLANMPWLVRHATYTPAQALAELASRMGRQARHLDLEFFRAVNPLPPSALLQFAPPPDDYDAWLADTQAYLAALPGVDQVVVNPLHTEMGRSWRLFSQRLLWPALGLLGLLVALIIGITIRLSLASRAAEIDILQLVGAENWYIRLPLVTGGALVGLLGGAAGAGLAWLAWFWLAPLAHFPPLVPALILPPWPVLATLALSPMLMGAIGSFFAVRTNTALPAGR